MESVSDGATHISVWDQTGDGCVQFRCAELVMVHRTSVSGPDLVTIVYNLGMWSQ